MTTDLDNVTSSAIDAALAAYQKYRAHELRYASFDFCHNYFQGFRHRNETKAIAAPAHLQRSCLELAFYLASWGMIRGSSDLLNKSYWHLKALIAEIAHADPRLWVLQVSCYDDEAWDMVNEFRRKILGSLSLRGDASDTLVTKIMLGVFGNVPAFDTFFKRGFGSATFGPKAFRRLRSFYDAHRAQLDSVRIFTLDFGGGETRLQYPVAKLIDMIFFIRGQIS
jgi:hypothetical protein